MDEINCIVCEKPIKFPSYIDPDDYEGHIFCHECNLLLYLKMKSSRVRKYQVVTNQTIKVQPNVIFKSGVPRPAKQQEQ
jgi:hypothetical protein